MKRLLSLLLVVLMLTALFSACAKEEKPAASPSASTPAETSPTPSEDPGPVEIVDLEMWLPEMGYAGLASKADLVREKINEITEREIGVHVNISWISLFDLGTQLTLAMADNQVVDLVGLTPAPNGNFTNLYTTGATLNIEPYLDEHAPELKALMAEMGLLAGYTMQDGGVYGVPTYRQLNTNLYIVYRADILREAGLYDYFYNMKTWADYEELLVSIKNLGTLYATGGGQSGYAPCSGTDYLQPGGNIVSGSFSDIISVDNLGGTLGITSDSDGNVYSLPETESYVNVMKTIADWYNKGYVYPDTPIATEQPEALIAQGMFAGYVIGSEFGVEANKSQSCGTEMSCLMIAPGMIKTANTKSWGCMVPVTSAYPEKAVELINLIYTSNELMTLFNWGVEGETYVVVDGEATYPEGKDATTSGFHYMDFVFGNQFLALPWKGSGGPTFREDALADFKAAPVSPYMGLTVDTGPHATLISSLTTVYDEYNRQLISGQYTDQMYDEYIAKLKTAGMDDYVALFQSAVDEFLK